MSDPERFVHRDYFYHLIIFVSHLSKLAHFSSSFPSSSLHSSISLFFYSSSFTFFPPFYPSPMSPPLPPSFISSSLHLLTASLLFSILLFFFLCPFFSRRPPPPSSFSFLPCHHPGYIFPFSPTFSLSLLFPSSLYPFSPPTPSSALLKVSFCHPEVVSHIHYQGRRVAA